MTDTTELAQSEAATKRRGLTAMRLAELQDLAQNMGISDTAKMRKGDLISAIKGRQGGSSVEPAAAPVQRSAPDRRARSTRATDSGAAPAAATTSGPTAEQEAVLARLPLDGADRSSDSASAAPPARARRSRRASSAVSTPPAAAAPEQTLPQEQPRERDQSRVGDGVSDTDARTTRGDGRGEEPRDNGRGSDRRDNLDSDRRDNDRRDSDRRDQGEGDRRDDRRNGQQDRQRGDRDQRSQNRDNRSSDNRSNDNRSSDNRSNDNRSSDNRSNDNRSSDNRSNDNRSSDNRSNDNRSSDNRSNDNNFGDSRDNRGNNRRDDDDTRGGRRRNRQRSRDRKRRGGRTDDYAANEQVDTQIADDDVIVPVAGILELLDNYAFVRTSGYLPGPNDVYVPMGIVKKNGLRKGDAVTGAVRALREGEQLPARQKFNALVRLDTVNGQPPEEQRNRVEFNKLTPLYPQQRLRLETEANILTTRIIDLVSPVGKGQRGLIVAPAKAGKTMVMQAIANAITTNNPECHLMVVLVDERPEEVTDMQRAVKGEVISSTFDRPATDHTTVAELAIERAKRLVELGHDVVVLLDSITKLGRAYNLAAPASGRILSGGVDSAALYPPKRFFGAARNIEHGGSLTILATALVETGSKMDEVIFEEFKGTGNMELKLDRQLANRRIFPAVDINNSSTRREEILLAPAELKIMWKLRRVLAALDQQQGIELLIDRLKKAKSNTEFLMTVQSSSNIKLDDE